MATPLQSRLSMIEQRIQAGLDEASVSCILELMGAPAMPPECLQELRLYSEFLPKAAEHPFTVEQRMLHFLWDVLDKYPMSLSVPFAIPFRRLIAQRLFAGCGRNFICEEQVRFNYGQNIRCGRDVFLNRGVYLDSKGGIELGDYSVLAENVKVFSHNHRESCHVERDYLPVVVKPFAKVYANAVILPGVTIGSQAIVAGGSVVTHDVPENAVVAGVPAKVIRERDNKGRHDHDLGHIWLHNGAFQDTV